MASGGQLREGPVADPGPRRSRGRRQGTRRGWDAWGHRKLAELKRVGIDDVEAGSVSDSTMYRALKRNGLCLPVGHTAEVRQLAGVRREAFIVPPTRRNRLWQAAFSEFETLGQGTWNLGGVVDYWAKVNLACTVTVTKTTNDAIAFFEAALLEVEVLLGVDWVQELTDPESGEIAKLTIVTDIQRAVLQERRVRCVGRVEARRHPAPRRAVDRSLRRTGVQRPLPLLSARTVRASRSTFGNSPARPRRPRATTRPRPVRSTRRS